MNMQRQHWFAPGSPSRDLLLLLSASLVLLAAGLGLRDPWPADEPVHALIARDMLPIDLLRCKLAFFGANRFDPRSDLWVRINLFAGEPYPDEMETAR